ncbi:amino acid-binding ACT protein [Nocardioides sp. zg-536]|uniref:Amino acid-binding ACT protein n=1 Tax=Nocardioides faecalis TaxID=2803858 RepID=A0A939BXB1_9ACTN|nr:amino acid-binding ACT protein [Nocardioides faecalis]QVI57840.1 amino acid-binding ACT protein [Nocardioides faecalis]
MSVVAHLVLTVVGDDRAGLVETLADTVAEHGGNWERSELAELAGAFAGIVLVSVPADRVDALLAALGGLEGLLRVVPHQGTAPSATTGATGSTAGAEAVQSASMTFTVLGNDRPGIVRDITAALNRHGLSVDRFTSRTLQAPMAGGVLFEATVEAHGPSDVDVHAATAALELLAGEIQVDLTLG